MIFTMIELLHLRRITERYIDDQERSLARINRLRDTRIFDEVMEERRALVESELRIIKDLEKRFADEIATCVLTRNL